jgi:hypothetical protein
MSLFNVPNNGNFSNVDIEIECSIVQNFFLELKKIMKPRAKGLPIIVNKKLKVKIWP